MTVRKTLRWVVVLLVLGGLAGGGYGWWFWTQTDELLRREILKRKDEIAPDWDMQIGRAYFDWNRRIHIRDVSIKARGQAAPVMVLPEVVLTLDRDALSRTQDVVIQKVHVVGPVLDLVRDRDGAWNFTPLLRLRRTDRPLPEWEFERGTIRIALDRPGASPGGTTLRGAELRLIPSARRHYLVQGALAADRVGTLTFDGQWDVDGKTWGLNGHMQDVTAAGELLALAAGASPEFHEKLVRAEQALQQSAESAAPAPVGGPPMMIVSRPTPRPDGEWPGLEGASPEAPDGGVRAADRGIGPRRPPAPATPPRPDRPEPAPTAPPSYIPDFGVQGRFDLDVRIEQSPQTGTQYKSLVTARQGQVTHAALPFPLRDVQGKLYCDNRQIVVRNLRGSNGTTQVWMDGSFERAEAAAGWLDVRIADLTFDERLRNRLPADVRPLYDAMNPQGMADVATRLRRAADGRWTTEDFRLTAKRCTIAHKLFAYEATGLVGTVEQRGAALFVVNLDGMLGSRPVAVRGTLRDPGPRAEVQFDITAHDLPLDERFSEACPPAARRVLDVLGLKGTVGGSIRLSRAPGPHQELEVRIAGQLKNCSLEYVEFPYRLTDLTGAVEFDSITGNWTFSNLKAVHGTANLSGAGTYVREAQPQLRLVIDARGVPLDKHLELALPEAVRSVWSDVSPSGRIDTKIGVTWTHGSEATVEIPELVVQDAAIRLRAFPWPIDRIQARLAWRARPDMPGVRELTIHDFSGWHDQTYLGGHGLVQRTDQGLWRVRFNRLDVDDLVPNAEFQAALGPDLRHVMQSLDPRGPVSIKGGVELSGTDRPHDPVTAAWDLEAVLAGGQLNAGTVLENIHGSVSSRGTWDGARANMTGTVDLRSVEVFDKQLMQVRGPWQLNGTQLVIGAREALTATTPIELDRRLTARAFGEDCVLTLDAVATLADEPTYHLLANISGGRLEEYARRYLPGATNLSGVMNGWVDLEGRGSSAKQMQGRGKFQISPAALYELPIIVQMFQVLSLGPPDKTAFKYAFADFRVAGGALHFNGIDLVGDTISFRGQGAVRFADRIGDSPIDLDFYSRMPRNRVPIPVLRYAIGWLSEATTGWVGIEVEGTLDDPHARLKPAPALDEALRRFLSAFEQPVVAIPRFVFPTLVPLLPQSPAERRPPANAPRRPMP